ncbi:uncharacterized protein N0V89_008237 [Didymosphaeria variabile]|uniref:Thioredoxin domain-containing protein n=1 Tax=Didymosphaeria variabile TaxID=1932322 RepID=A0A9W8XHQ9_9PLEO|nr:uncharacterized protein N0V89_008237 [Didymosphaeria variabile]KAJ4349621.1 hypothetical protein N0V89_008237 [Didymosphaeria variabile]
MATAKPIESKADFEAAIAEPTKFVIIYVYEEHVPEGMRERFQAEAPAFADKVEHYKLDIAQNAAEAKEKMNLEKVPALLVYKAGEEVERLYELGEESMKALAGKLLG